MDDTIIFIDSGFLSKLSKHLGKGKYLNYKIPLLAKNLALNQDLHCKQIFYYTAPPFQSGRPTKEEAERYRKYERFIKKLKEDKIITVREGRCQRFKTKNGEFIFKQKGVDSLVIIDIMSIPIRHPNVKKIILIACDSDFVPVIRELYNADIKTILYAYYEKKRNSIFSTSNELIKSVYKYVLLKKEDFDKAKVEK